MTNLTALKNHLKARGIPDIDKAFEDAEKKPFDTINRCIENAKDRKSMIYGIIYASAIFMNLSDHEFVKKIELSDKQDEEKLDADSKTQ